jgi:pimeloyl-ACP methyl ester carboxylesterase
VTTSAGDAASAGAGASNQSPSRPLRVDLGRATPSGEAEHLAGTWFPATSPAAERDRPVLVCLPGGTYNHRYYDLEVPGRTGYSFARHAAERGFPVAAFDMLGTGDSSQPDREVDLSDQGAAVASAVDQLPDLVGRAGPFVGIGHSLGGYVAMYQQAAHRSYDAVAILGTTNHQVVQLGIPDEMVEAAATAEGRAALADQLIASLGDGDRYLVGDRTPMHDWFHATDVPADVIAADDATTLTAVVRRAGLSASIPGIARDQASTIDVPVFLAYGEVDISPAPHAEPTFFTASPDVTLFVLPGSAHCHNMANTRARLWDRLLAWCTTATTATTAT